MKLLIRSYLSEGEKGADLFVAEFALRKVNLSLFLAWNTISGN